jgi:hypothetical protein
MKRGNDWKRKILAVLKIPELGLDTLTKGIAMTSLNGKTPPHNGH